MRIPFSFTRFHATDEDFRLPTSEQDLQRFTFASSLQSSSLYQSVWAHETSQKEFREHRVDHHCSLSPGERTLWRLTPCGSTQQPDSLSLSIRSHSPPTSLPPFGSAATTPRCTLLHQPSLRPGVFSLPGASESGPWSSAESTLFAPST